MFSPLKYSMDDLSLRTVKLQSHPISSRHQENPLVSIKCVFCSFEIKSKCVFVFALGNIVECCDAVYHLHDVQTGDCLPLPDPQDGE